MQQSLECTRCGSQTDGRYGFCGHCGQRLQYNCPFCQIAVRVMLLECPTCSMPLPVYAPFPFINPQTLSDKRGYEHLNGLLWNLAYIGKLKSSLPLQLRGFCNALLFVQIRDLEAPANGSEHFIVTAGTSTLIPKIGVICRDNSWDIIKYEPGDWEKLVAPSIEIVVWLVKRGGIEKQEENLFNRAIKDFHKYGRLELF